MSNATLTAALQYAERGLSVVPVDADSKVSLVSWKPYQSRHADAGEIRRWYAQYPRAGVAIVTGHLSGMAAVDVDGRAGEAALIGRLLPPTPVVLTPREGGHHYWYRYPPGETLGSPANVLPHVDVRGESGYIIAPPTRRTTGEAYRWADTLSLDAVPLAPCPEWVREVARKSAAPVAAAVAVPATAAAALPPPLVAGEALYGEALAAWDTNLDFARAVAYVVGVPAEAFSPLGQPFRCVLPGHDDTHPSASLFQTQSGRIMYRDWHEREGVPWFTLSEVFAAQRYGEAQKLKPPEHARWFLRLTAEMGFARPVEVEMPPLPTSGVPPAARKVYEGFKLLLGCRWLCDAGEPTPFTRAFSAAWCGLPESTAYTALKWLGGRGFIVKAGEQPHYGKSLYLFLPGTPELVAQRACER